MSEQTDLGHGRQVRIDYDGIVFGGPDGESIRLDHDMLDELREWLGYVRREEYRLVRDVAESVGEVLRASIPEGPGRTMGGSKISGAVSELVSDQVVLVRTASGRKIVGVVTDTFRDEISKNQIATEEMWAVTVRPLSDPTTTERLVMDTVHEPQTREHPGYHGVEQVGLDDGGGVDPIEWIEVRRGDA